METAFNSIDRQKWSFSSDDPKYIRAALKLKEQAPHMINIMAMPKDNDGCIYAFIDPKCISIRKPRVLSEQQRLQAAKRLQQMRRTRSNSRPSEEVDTLQGSDLRPLQGQ